MPLVQTRGAASAQGFGEFAQAAVAANYIEDVFSTFLYEGTGATQTITNDIDLSGKGGLTWIKGRSGATGHRFTDTVRGATKSLASNSTDAEATESTGLTAFSSTGFTIGADADYNTSAATYCSWTFREQEKFFDIVTYTGNGVTTGRTINHNLGSAPGMMILKVIDLAGDDWYVYHRSIPTTVLALNSTSSTAPTTPATIFGNGSTTVAPTSTQVTIGGTANSNGYSYVLYLFAHDAGGFGTAGTDNVISCGSFTTDANGNATVNLGYEPQYLMYKSSSAAGSWTILDTMRAFCATNQSSNRLAVQSTSAESAGLGGSPSATGFYGDDANYFAASNTTYIYMAIRRPMKVPTTGTSVFAPALTTDDSVIINAGFPVDQFIYGKRDVAFLGYTEDRLRGSGQTLRTNTTGAEVAQGVTNTFDNNTGIIPSLIGATTSMIAWMLRRAPGFFDVVCYTGTGSATTQTHNLGVVPELMIVKRRDTTGAWRVYVAPLGNTNFLGLNETAASTASSSAWNNTTPTSSVFTIGNGANLNASGGTYANYLFATCAGVSKVGSYTGNGGTQTINCGFTGGARFVLIKRTDDSSDWYVWDTARGIISGNDPYLLLNSTAAEVTGTDYIDPASSGFELSSTAPADINASSGNFIFLAIA